MSNAFTTFVSGAQNWDVTSFFNNSARYVKTAGGGLLLLLGACLIVFGGFKIFRAITGRQGQQGPQWFTAILAILFGGIMVFGGIQFFIGVSGGGNTTVTKLGSGGGGNAHQDFNDSSYDGANNSSSSIQTLVNHSATQLFNK